MPTSHRMDDKWFKQKQKQASVTQEDIAKVIGRDRSVVSRIYNDKQKMSLDQAEAFAELLKVPLQDVLVRAGIAAGHVAQQVQPGFAESDAAIWVPRDGGRDEHAALVAEAMKSGRNGVDVWRVNSSSLALAGYLIGDYLLVDHRDIDPVRAGTTVVAQVYDWQLGTSATVLRRFEPPVLVAASTDPNEQGVHVVDHNNVTIKGKVIASWRI